MSEIRLLELSRFQVCEAFCIGQEIVATGIVQKGIIEPGDEFVLVTPSGKQYVVAVNQIESFNSSSNQITPCNLAGKGQSVGLRLRGASKEQFEIGSLLCRFRLSLA